MPTNKTLSDAMKDMPMMMPTAGFKFIMAANRAWLRGLSEYSREMSKFVSHRLDEDATFQAKLAECEKPTDAFQVYSDFTQNAFKEYADEQKTMQQVTADAVSHGLDSAGKVGPKTSSRKAKGPSETSAQA